MAIVEPTSSMTGSFSNKSVIAVFVKASNDTTSLGELAGGDSTDFAKIGLIDTATLNMSTTMEQREAENSKTFIKVVGGKKEKSLTVDALIPTNAVLSCANGYIADYYAGNVNIPDDRSSFTGEAILMFLDEDEDWDNVASIAHYGIEYWKSVQIIPNGSKTFDGTSSHIEPFEIHLQRHSSGQSVRKIPANDASGIDVRNEFVDFSSVTA